MALYTGLGFEGGHGGCLVYVTAFKVYELLLDQLFLSHGDELGKKLLSNSYSMRLDDRCIIMGHVPYTLLFLEPSPFATQ